MPSSRSKCSNKALSLQIYKKYNRHSPSDELAIYIQRGNGWGQEVYCMITSLHIAGENNIGGF